ncbi:MAG: hypothetical protein ABIZ04_05060 [Opitutus sp.]
MKRPPLILALSVTANVALFAWWLVPKAVDRNDPIAVLPKSPSSVSNAADDRSIKESPPTASQPLWQQLDSDGDLAGVVSRLRAAGFPPKLVRAIVSTLVAEQFDAERYKIDEVALHTSYWKPWPNSYQDPKVGPALRKLQRDQQGVIKQLLGEPGPDEVGEESRAWDQLTMGNLPPEKLERLKKYSADNNERAALVYSAAIRGASMLATDREKLMALEKTFNDGLGEILTPAEAEEYTLRNGRTANQLKWMLNPFRASEDEYRTIFPLYQGYLDKFPAAAMGQPPGTSVDPTQKGAQDAMMAQLASRLGQQRADDLRLALDPKYAQLNRLVSRLDLPLAASKQVLDVQQDIQQRAALVRDNATLAASERTEHLNALAREASTRISSALGGARGFNVYKENGGQWLASLTPPPKS